MREGVRVVAAAGPESPPTPQRRMTQKLLFVCLGNICRSPAAEGVFLHLLEERGLSDQFVVDSAGTGGWHVGNPADRRMQAAANRRGIQLPSRARQISLDDFSSFDLVLTMDDDNLAAVQGLAREAGPRATASIKPMLSYAGRFSETEVPDPYYGGEAGFGACARPARGCLRQPARRAQPAGVGQASSATRDRNCPTRASITASMLMPSVTSSTASSACTSGASSRVLSR